MALLDIRELSVGIDGASILDSVSISLEAGAILGIAGESGSGKTMTALAVAGLLPASAVTSGQILLDGSPLTGLGERDFCDVRGRDVGIVFQEPMTALNPLMTIGEQVAETARIHRGLSRRDALRLARQTLDKVGLSAADFPLDRYPHIALGNQPDAITFMQRLAVDPNAAAGKLYPDAAPRAGLEPDVVADTQP